MKRKKTPKIPNNLMYLAILAFLIVATTAVSYSVVLQKRKDVKAESDVNPKNLAPIPTLTNSVTFPIISAQGALALDLDTMMPLYEKNPDKKLLPASTTKIITAMVAMDAYPPDYVLTVDGKSIDGQKMGLIKGERITVNSLIQGLLVYSANDAAEVLAENYPGGRDAFISAMNDKARQLHLDNSYFENPTGFDGGNNYTTTRDLIRLAIIAMDQPEFARVVSQKEITVKSLDDIYVHKLSNTNKLLVEVEGVKGVKTGWTENARENLVTYMERDNHKIMIALLGSQDRFGETKELIDWIYTNYEWKEVSFK